MESPQTKLPILALAEQNESDVFLFSGPISRKLAEQFIDTVEKRECAENVSLILTTYGGDADAAFIISRFLKRKYNIFFLYVFDVCKSAGTLIACGADQIIMGCKGELGPLDVQLVKEDTLGFSSSGLDIYNSLNDLLQQAFSSFEHCFLQILQRSGGRITTRTAANIATDFAIGLVRPIAEQLDPMRLGEIRRAMNIAKDYGVRLGVDEDLLDKLIMGYPSHSFVIDIEEAKQLFASTRETNELEIDVESFISKISNDGIGSDIIREPSEEGVIIDLVELGERLESHMRGEHDETDEMDSDLDSEEIGESGNENQST